MTKKVREPVVKTLDFAGFFFVPSESRGRSVHTLPWNKNPRVDLERLKSVHDFLLFLQG